MMPHSNSKNRSRVSNPLAGWLECVRMIHSFFMFQMSDLWGAREEALDKVARYEIPFELTVPEGLQRKPTIVLVDDDTTLTHLLTRLLERAGCEVFSFDSGEAALKYLQHHGPVDIVLLDVRLPGISGLELLPKITQADLALMVILMTAHATMDDAIQALKDGAYDFVAKEVGFEDLRLALRNALETLGLRDEVATLRRKLAEQESDFGEIIATSQNMRKVMKLVRKVRNSDITVLILGESGSGKEMIARAIHDQDSGSDRPFVAINCAAIPESLLESELFGYVKGAFTGATGTHVGKFEEADGGTLFLDEIGEMGMALQAKLLRVLQSKEIQPIGGPSKQVDVRIVSATNQNLAKNVRNGKFREDLYYRLAVFPIELPPLRDREGDISVLVNHFLRKFSQQEKKKIIGLSPEVRSHMGAYNWPGNVRELENVIYRAVILAEGNTLEMGDFPLFSLDTPYALETPERSPQEGRQTPQAEAPAPFRTLDETEAKAIREALLACGGNVTRTATMLKIGRATLYRKFSKYGISPNNLTGLANPS